MERASHSEEEDGERQLSRLLRAVCGDDAPGLARRLIAEYGSLAAVFSVRRDQCSRIVKDTVAAEFLSDVSESFASALRFEVERAPIITSSQTLVDYLHLAMGCASSEQFRVLFLNSAHALIRDEVMSAGSVTHAPVFPREIIKRALELGAAAIILVHNHPSGDPHPSKADIDMTHKIASAARCMDIAMCDHIIIARMGWVSFRALGLL
ncbi:MAG: DNA repair protein RadC [Pseudomonadota bacterium]